MGVWPMICKIPPYYQFRRPSSKTVTYLFYCGLELTRFYLSNEVVRPRWRGRGLAGCSSGEWPSDASSFPSTMCSGRYSGFPSVSSRRRRGFGVNRRGAVLQSPIIQLSLSGL